MTTFLGKYIGGHPAIKEFTVDVLKKVLPELREDLLQWVSRIPHSQTTPQPPVSVPGVGASDDGDARIRQLKDLAELRDQGVLSDEEFAAEKARVRRA